MQRYFIEFSYDGANYHGWQIQPNGTTVQEVMQCAISTLLRQELQLVGAGRTDAGVHASKMVAHFDLELPLDKMADNFSPVQLVYKLNRLLPQDIAVSSVYPVDNELHARFSAVKRTYHYFIHTRKMPFRRSYSWEVHYDLNFQHMNEAAACLLSVDDFASFCKAGADVKTTLCNVCTAHWVEDEPGCWHFEIAANRFLRNMVRAVVGTLVEVGRGRMTIEQFREVVRKRQRTAAGESMPAHALFLVDVEYPKRVESL